MTFVQASDTLMGEPCLVLKEPWGGGPEFPFIPLKLLLFYFWAQLSPSSRAANSTGRELSNTNQIWTQEGDSLWERVMAEGTGHHRWDNTALT